jgi:DHA2 family multidrug resistance protein
MVMALMPVVGFLVRKIQPKYIIVFGFIISAFSLYHLAGFNTDVSFKKISLARVYQAAGVAFLFIPIQSLAYANLPQGKSNKASALINLMRNLGGSVGISVGTTLLSRRSQIHQNRLVSHLSPTSLPFQQQLHALTERFVSYGVNSIDAAKHAMAVVMRQVQVQAAMLSYLDTFVVLMIGCLIAAALAAFLTEIDLSKAGPGHG